MDRVAADSTPYEKAILFIIERVQMFLLDKSVRRREMSKICGSPYCLAQVF